MESNPHKKTIKTPDSDQTARKEDFDATDETTDRTGTNERQTSNKSGKHSAAEKLTASRPEFGASPGAKPVPGASGNPEEDEEHAPSGAHRDKALQNR